MARKWRNNNADFPQKPYDLIREMLVALGIMGALVLVLAAVFSTPDVPALTAQQVARQDPKLLLQNALDDLSGQDAISTYGPPYNNSGTAQSIAGFSPAQIAGVQIPINSAKVNVLDPLNKVAKIDTSLQSPLQTWSKATVKQRSAWVNHIESALNHATLQHGVLVVPAASPDSYGPLPTMLNAYLGLARSGLLESAIDGGSGPMPATNRTESLLLLQDVPDAQYANQLDMSGNQWGIIKETGNYPGAVWLWFYTLLYQIPPFVNSSSADLEVVLTTGIVTILLVLTPFIPGLRSLPKVFGIYKLIWRRWYRTTTKKGRGHA